MVYKFLNFYFDVDKKELYFQKEKLHLTQQNYKLLKVFVENPNQTINKDLIVKEVWNNRVVEDNTIDQAFSKLRKLLNSKHQSTYFEVGYGKGWSFLPQIKDSHSNQHKAKIIPLLAIVFLFAIVFIFQWGQKEQRANKSLVMFVPQEFNESNQWWSSASAEIIENLFGQSHQALIKEYQADTKQIVHNDYLQYLWKVSPDLNVISTKVEKDTDTNEYTLSVIIENPNQESNSKTFKHKSIKHVYKKSSEWLKTVYGIEVIPENILPDNENATELFLQGMKNLKLENYDKSINYLKLSLQEVPEFNLARLKLAEVYKKTNQFDKALTQLETVQIDKKDIASHLKVIGYKGDIYEIQGKHQLAKKLYETTISNELYSSEESLNEIRYYLSDVYFSLADNQNALKQLNTIEQNLNKQSFPYLLADTYRQQGQVNFTNGEFKLAEKYTQKALNYYTDLGDVIGQIKGYASLSRFLQHQHKYDEAIGYINKALALAKVKENKLIIGATINQLIYLLYTKGLMREAWEMTQEMENIGLELGYTRMVIAAKHHFAELARLQQKFDLSKASLGEHLSLAIETDNKRAIHTNNLLMLDYLLDQKKDEGVQDIIDKVQTHIDETKEKRLQPVLNLQQARLNLLLNKTEHIVELLNNSILQAKETEDGETIVMINNFLAEFYILNNDADKALKQLNENTSYHPPPNPYLLIRAKIHQLKGEYSQALELVNQCKIQSNQIWYAEDQNFLDNLKNQLANH